MESIFQLQPLQLMLYWIVSVVIGLPFYFGMLKGRRILERGYPERFESDRKLKKFSAYLFGPKIQFPTSHIKYVHYIRVCFIGWQLVMIPMAIVFFGTIIMGFLK